MSGKTIQQSKKQGKRQAAVRCPNCDSLSDGFPCESCGYRGKAVQEGGGAE